MSLVAKKPLLPLGFQSFYRVAYSPNAVVGSCVLWALTNNGVKGTYHAYLSQQVRLTTHNILVSYRPSFIIYTVEMF